MFDKYEDQLRDDLKNALLLNDNSEENVDDIS
jgi:hypothetical protein